MGKVIVLADESFKIIGAAMEVHRIIGCGFSEVIYQEALEEELSIRGIPFSREKVFSVTYKGKTLSKFFRPDFICYDKVIVELKTVSDFTEEHVTQVLNYLKATGLKLGILINFGKESLEYKRILRNPKWDINKSSSRQPSFNSRN